MARTSQRGRSCHLILLGEAGDERRTWSTAVPVAQREPRAVHSDNGLAQTPQACDLRCQGFERACCHTGHARSHQQPWVSLPLPNLKPHVRTVPRPRDGCRRRATKWAELPEPTSCTSTRPCAFPHPALGVEGGGRGWNRSLPADSCWGKHEGPCRPFSTPGRRGATGLARRLVSGSRLASRQPWQTLGQGLRAGNSSPWFHHKLPPGLKRRRACWQMWKQAFRVPGLNPHDTYRIHR